MIKSSLFEGFLFAFKRITTYLTNVLDLRMLVRGTLFLLYRCYTKYMPGM